MRLVDLQEQIESLRREHVHALSAFHAWEELQVFKSRVAHGEEKAQQHVKAYNQYAGFLTPAEHALLMDGHITLAKLYIGKQGQALTLGNLFDSLQVSPVPAEDIDSGCTGFKPEAVQSIALSLKAIEPARQTLRNLRNKLWAHLDLKGASDEFLVRKDVIDLLETSEKVLNTISAAHWGNAAYFEQVPERAKRETHALLKIILNEYMNRMKFEINEG